VQVTMRGVIDQNGSGPFITVPDLQLLAEGSKGVVWIVALTQLDGRPFSPGRYRLETEKHDIRSAIVTATGGPLPQAALQPWSGVTRGHLELIVTAPSTPAEVAMMYVQRGEVAFDRRQFEEAVALYRQAIDAHPSNAGRTLQLLGGTYLAMGRYAEALPVLQRLPIRVPLVQAFLAEAHVGVGDEAEAVDLLRRNGWAEAEVAARIADLRVRVASRPRR
jgi:tetratricopeptide (TPR) repeat protein